MKRAAMVLLFASIACGGESDETEVMDEEETTMLMTDREGPAGCYVPQRMMCDCALTEAQCTGETMVWVPNGCASCQM